MRRCAFLTLDDPKGFVMDDELAVAPLRELGWEVESVSWRARDVEWGGFEAAVIRSTWDYWSDVEVFVAALEGIAKRTRLLNPLDVVRWNLHKTYLRDLAGQGVHIVPTVFGRGLTPDRVAALHAELGAEEIVVKPAVGAAAVQLHRLRRGAPGEALDRAAGDLADCEYLAQPFIPSVVQDGEISLFYFGGDFSHAVRKLPAAGDFRVQEEHGASILPHDARRDLVGWGRQVLDAAGPPLLYARVDLVRDGADRPALMELELVEPALYLRVVPGAPERFARAFDAWMRTRT